MSEIRHYRDDDVDVRIRGVEFGDAHITIEHGSGAALIVPACKPHKTDKLITLKTVGFDGTSFEILLDDEANTITIRASSASPILGGEVERTVPRRENLSPSGAVRVTGNEQTMPIAVDE